MNTYNKLSKYIPFQENRFPMLAILFVILSLGLTSCLANFFATKGCEPTLMLGVNKFQIQTLNASSGGELKIPSNHPGNAYWIKGTETNYVFGLSPTDANFALQSSLKAGDEAVITWDNCNSVKFKLSATQSGVPDNTALLDQSVSGMTVFVQPTSDALGFMVKGELSQETITNFNTPDTTCIQAEVSLLETTTSSDGKTIRVGVSILNRGQSPIKLSTEDVSLTPENSAPTAPEKSEPNLPKEIKPGATGTFYFTFVRPDTKTATIKVLGVEYDLDSY